MNSTDKTEERSPAVLSTAGLDGEKLLFEEWWGEPPTELNILEQRSDDQVLAMWVWQAWQARAKLEPPNEPAKGRAESASSDRRERG